MPPDGAFSQSSLWPERWAAQPLDRSGTGPARPSWASTTVAPGSGGALDGGGHGDGVRPATVAGSVAVAAAEVERPAVGGVATDAVAHMGDDAGPDDPADDRADGGWALGREGAAAALDAVVHRRVLARVDGSPVDDARLTALVRAEAPLLAADEVSGVVARVRARIGGVGPLEPLMADPRVTDILVNGPGRVWVERTGRLQRSPVVLDRAAIDLLVERVVAPLGLRADRSAPIVDARLPDGSRVHVVLPPLAIDGPSVTIRRFGATTLPLTAFCAPPVAELLARAVDTRMNMVVCGATGAGKTTLLNALCQHLPPGERVVTVEDAAELRLPGDHVVRLETRPAAPDGPAAVTVRDLVRAALRMRPDRIVVGEVRGAETLDMLQAMNTGHDGSLSSCHANGPADALRRLETMALTGGADLPLAAVREQVAGAVDLLVHVARGVDGRRRVAAVAEVSDDPACPRRTRPLAQAGRVVGNPQRPPRGAAAGGPS